MSAIIYSRVSRLSGPKEYQCMSLDSQEHAILEFIKNNNFKLFKVLKEIGSAFSRPQTDLKNALQTCKNKVLIVFDPTRLSRNTRNFSEIHKICKKNKHKIAIVTLNRIFDTSRFADYETVFKLIERTEKESRDQGDRIRRTIRYKKSQKVLLVKKVNIDKEIEENVCDEFEKIYVNSNAVPEYISIWYDPKFGLPPNVKVPEGMTLPKESSMLYIPKL